MIVSSNRRALAVLVAVCVALWMWWYALEWYSDASADREFVQKLHNTLLNGWMLSLLSVASNAVVWRWVTVPLWRNAYAINKPNGVLGLAILFHLTFLLLVFSGLLLLVFGSNDGAFLRY